MSKMVTLRAQVNEEKAGLFRIQAMKLYGNSKDSISKALNEAVDKWLDNHEGKEKKTSISDLVGILSDLKDSSLAAQKKAVRMYGKVD